MRVADMTPAQYAMAQVRYAKYRSGEKYQAAQERFKAKGGRNRLAVQHRHKVKAERPEVYRAWLAVAAAVKDGRLTPPDHCPCGRRTRLDAHHLQGYEVQHQLDVEWLCRRCHKAAHRKEVV